jgi:hypothetical protein
MVKLNNHTWEVTTCIWQPISSFTEFAVLSPNFLFHCISLDVLFFQLWSKLLRSRELDCLNARPWMSRPKLWDSSHGFELFIKYHDPDGIAAGLGLTGLAIHLKGPPSSWTELTLGFLLQISSEMVAGCLCWRDQICWLHARWLECSGLHTVILERPTDCLSILNLMR